MFGIVDCNTMYSSVETIFRPDLRGRGVAVCSNNDGCIVTLNAEAKAAGLEKFKPYFQVKDFCKKNDITIMSSNYALYADISNKVMSIIESEVPEMQQYSIDESFFLFRNMNEIDYRVFGHKLKNRLHREVRMPVCVGFGTSKTLAKLANHIAKKNPISKGVCCLDEQDQIDRWLARIEVNNVWGVGQQTTLKLNSIGIETALQLSKADPLMIKNEFSIVLERTVRELRGESCLSLHEPVVQQQQIIVSRSFGQKVGVITEVRSAIATHIVRAMERLRNKNLYVKGFQIFAHARGSYDTSSISKYIKLPTYTQDTSEVLKLATKALESIFVNGPRYSKAGVMLLDLVDSENLQLDLLNLSTSPKNQKLNKLLDKLNEFDKVVTIGSAGQADRWQMRQEYKSPSYTTSIHDIPIIKC